MVEVVATDEFVEWYSALVKLEILSVTEAVGNLAKEGLSLGYPAASQIKGASFALRELRVQSSGKPLRVFYAFDPRREAVLILGGDKTGDDRSYDRMIRQCERIWKDYLAGQLAGLHDKEH